jgi:hypothetical protein
MTSRTLVDRYLEALRECLAWRVDQDDLVSEIKDHLLASIERLEAEGMGPSEAARASLSRIGAPNAVARAFVETPEGGLAVPTKFTRTGGTLAVFSAAMWLLLAAAWWIAGLTSQSNDHSLGGTVASISYGFGALALLLANPLTILTLIALSQRHGGLGLPGTAGLFIASIGAVGSLAAWVMIGWGAFGIVGLVLFGFAMSNRDIAPRIPTLAFSVSFACGGLVWLVGHVVGKVAMEVGFWGEDWLANELALTVTALLLAFALIRLGLWLRGEELASFDVSDGPLPV